MTQANIIVLIILAAAVVLFISERLRADVVAMMVLVALILTGLLSVEEAFSGFSSPAVITVWSVFIVSGGITRSGVGDRIAQIVMKLAGDSQVRLLIVIMLGVGLISAFMNNIGALAILLPAVISISRKMNISPSKLLIPLAWASLMGGNMTLIGTPPNILASALLESYASVDTFNFFDFTPMGIIVLSAGILYMVVIGRHLLPDRTPGGKLIDSYQIEDYLTEMRVMENSPLIGRTIQEANLDSQYGLNVIHMHVCCEEGDMVTPASDHRLQVGDELHIEATAEAILNATQVLNLVPVADHDIEAEQQSARRQTMILSEIALAPYGSLSGKSLQEIDLRKRYGISVLAIRHHGRTLFSRLGSIPLVFGDSLLVQGPIEKINLLRQDRQFLILEAPSVETRLTNKAPLAIIILLGILVVITLGWLHVSAAMFIGALLMVVGGVLRIEEAYQSIEWKSVFLIAGMLPLGLAMGNTGTARFLADQIIQVVGNLGPLAVLMGIFVLTALLTEVMSNAAATVLAVPIGIDAALHLGADPHAFVMAIVIAASTSFLMPVGHQVNVLVYGPAGYRFSDYTRVGIWLNLLLLILVALVLPIIWPLFP